MSRTACSYSKSSSTRPVDGDEPDAHVSLPLVVDVVLRAALGVAQHRVRLVHPPEPLGIAALEVVGVKPLRQQPVDARHHVGIGVRADLECFVVVGGHGVVHAADLERCIGCLAGHLYPRPAHGTA